MTRSSLVIRLRQIMPLARTTLSKAIDQSAVPSVGNPETILIVTAFLPQFIAPDHYALSFTILGTLFLAMEVLAVAIYAVPGSRIGKYLRSGRAMQWFNRASGSLMLLFSLGLLAMKRPDS
ncbi:LysE family transporter [Salinicola lusitanus]|uniref:LysE family transporter n=1 Tax=Salinicola lusitanus TaxID=1949085 RepID=A0ABZ3CW29_9GAMM